MTRTKQNRLPDLTRFQLLLPRVELLAEAQSDDHVEATRLALEGAQEKETEQGDTDG